MGAEGSAPREKRHPPPKHEPNDSGEEKVIIRKEVRKKTKQNRGTYPKMDYASSIPKHYEVSDAVKSSLQNFQKYHQIRDNGLPIWEIKEFGVTYEGPYQNYLPHGEGIAVFRHGEVYIGDFVNGQAETENGIYIFDDGSFYEGYFSKSMFNGDGVLVYHDKLKFKGKWEDGVPISKGQEKYEDNSEYIGGFKEGKWSGTGEYKWPNGMRYVGDFEEGLFDGFGTLYNKKGEITFTGKFKEGKKRGEGVLKTTYGTYKGQFINDEITGPGTFLWSDKKKAYVGNFHHNKMNGQGKIIYKTNQVASGFWQDNHNRRITQLQYQENAAEQLQNIINEHQKGLSQKHQLEDDSQKGSDE